jgi:hypothetical protein
MKLNYPATGSLLLVLLSFGCHFKAPDGGPLDITRYDSVIVEEVRLAPGVTETEVIHLVEGYTAVSVLESDKWKLAQDFDLEAFAAEVEAYATVAREDGEPIEPSITREEFLEKHKDAHAQWKRTQGKPQGRSPLRLKVLVTDVRFPDTLEGITMGTRPRMRCTVDAYADGKRQATGDMEAISGIPGPPLLPAAMAGRVAKELIFEEQKHRTMIKLADEMGMETIRALEAAK